MKKTLIALLIAPVIIGSACCAAETQKADNTAAPVQMQEKPTENCHATPQERAGITKALAYYIQAGRKGDSRIAQKGFAPSATMSWTENNALKTVPIKALYAYFDEKPRAASCEIAACSVAGNITMARVESAFDDARFTDMFTLVKDGENWKIVSKIYHLKK